MIDENIITFDEGRNCYTSDMQTCVYSLLQSNVPSSSIAPVISAVLKLAKRKTTILPSRTTVNCMNVQRLIIAHKQAEEQFAKQKNTCLLSDETCKFGRKYQGMHAADEDGNIWVLGIREMATKSGQSVLGTLLEILSDIDYVSTKSNNETSKQILLNISCTMSDRAATQIKFNELLQDFRKEVVTELYGNKWVELPEKEQYSLYRLCNFFCGLHLLVHLAEAASAALIVHEKGVFGTDVPIHDKSFLKSNEPGSARLIRTASKAFARGGDDKNGIHQQFKSYINNFLQQHKLRSLPLERFSGNRYNILFSSASNVFFLADQMNQYLEFGASNHLLQAVKRDLKVPEYLAGCKALGLVSHLITIPLWSQIENTDISILEIAQYYKELVIYLENIDYNKFITGQSLLSFVHENKLNTSKSYKALIRQFEHDNSVIVILKIMLPSLQGVLKRLLSDHLEGGVWDSPSEDLMIKTRSTPKHNKFSESIFGYLDRFLREKPNASLIAAEAYIAFCHNKTLAWLENKGEQKKAELTSYARREEPKYRSKFRDRIAAIQLEQRQIIKEKLIELERKYQLKIQKKIVMTDDICVWGLWQTELEVDQSLNAIATKTDKIKALSAQLKFRKNVLYQSIDNQALKNLYSLSKVVNGKRKKMSVDELSANVKALIACIHKTN